MAFPVTTNLVDKVLLWIHGRRLGLIGDGEATNTNPTTSGLLVLDGIPIAGTRVGPPSIPLIATSLSAAGAVTLAGAVVGDLVQKVYDQNSAVWVDVSADFETTISVAGQIQQTISTSGHGIVVFLQPGS
jgi:outer membrane lipoprotein SlyB